MTTPEHARTVEADIFGRIGAAKAELKVIDERRAAIAFDAETAGGEAKKEFDRLAKDRVGLLSRLEGLDHALAGARRHVSAADAVIQDEEERARAAMALELLASFVNRGAALDAKFTAVLDEYQALQEEFCELDILGFAPSSPASVAVNMKRAATAALMKGGLAEAFLAPLDRRSFAQVIEGWTASVQRRATTRLERDPLKEKETAQ